MGIPFIKESKIEVFYKGTPLRQFYKADFICYNISMNTPKWLLFVSFRVILGYKSVK